MRESPTRHSKYDARVDGDGGIARPWTEGPGPPAATTVTATITMSSCGSAAKHGSVSKYSTPDLRCDADQELQSPQRRTPPVSGAADPHHGLDSENFHVVSGRPVSCVRG